MKSEYNISLLKSGDIVSLNGFNCDVLGPLGQYDGDNNNSLVLKVKILDKIILFTGDIEKEAEDDLIKKYRNELDCDILKASHHGSKSSSSKEFLKYANPKNILISVGKNNWYGFPNNTLLLSYSNIHRTDVDMMVKIQIRKNYFHIRK